MKNLVEYILKGLVSYLPVLASVATAPKRTIAKRVIDQPERLSQALAFGGFTLALAFLLQAPLLEPGQDFVTVAGSLLVLRILAFASFAGIIVLLFRFVGGCGNFETTLCAGIYITSPVYLFVIVMNIIGIGIIASLNPDLAAVWKAGKLTEGDHLQNFIDSAPVAAASFMLIWLIQLFASTLWFLICWGSYREIHQVTRTRSAVVYLMTTVLWYIYWIASVFIMKGLYNGNLAPMG